MRSFLRSIHLLLMLAAVVLTVPALAASKSPNIIVILADDLGYGDLGCYGHPTIRTPHLDRMAAEGMRFTDFYVAECVCTPSRAALMTGRLPVRTGMCGDKRRVLFTDSPGGLPKDEITIAAMLKARGYATGCVGKWHLGHLPQYLPTSHGFDSYFGLPYSNDMDRLPTAPKGREAIFNPKIEYFNAPLMRGQEIIERPADQTSLTRRYTEEAVKFIREHKAGPFFLYFPHTFPHVPLFASASFKGKSPRGIYGDAVEELDWSVGQVLDTLRHEGLADNTLVFFTSDNGPWLIQDAHGGSAGLLRDGKGSTWEGGMREPGIAWWPGKIKAGSVQHALASSLDLLPTCAALAGVEPPRDRVLDGVNMAPMLLGTGPGQRDVMFYYRGTQLYAVRKGAFKAHYITQPAYGKGAPEKHDPPQLYDLAVDPSERFDVAKQHADVLADIAREVEKHRAGLKPAPSQLDLVAKTETAAATENGWKPLFDGKSLAGWETTDFIGKGKIEVRDGQIILGAGADLTGIHKKEAPLRMDYEIELDAMKVKGSDFFCALTFPVGKDYCSFVVGGWGGTIVGISSLDSMDASENETSKSVTFESNRWYHIAVRVTPKKIECWIDKEKFVDVVTEGRRISMRPGEIESSAPLGFASYDTAAALKNIRIKPVED